jgi:hypothetical protein
MEPLSQALTRAIAITSTIVTSTLLLASLIRILFLPF